MKKIQCLHCLMAAAVCVATVSLHAATDRITSEGDYPPHLQGVCTDGTNIWWSHTVELTRTDLKGKVLAHAKGLKSHHGDLCVVGGTLYVAVNHGKFNTEDKADSWVYAYRGDDLSFIKRWKVPELCHGARLNGPLPCGKARAEHKRRHHPPERPALARRHQTPRHGSAT